jgi:hypothetical protein
MKEFDQPDECDVNCAWLIHAMDFREEERKSYLVCAIAVNASDLNMPRGPANWMEEQ